MTALSLRRACVLAVEARRKRILLDHLVWHTLPWYRRLARTLLGLRPEPL
jgi:hypothetical protein